jgi:teichuronic acid exporter
VAWGIVVTHAVSMGLLYVRAQRVVKASVMDLLRALQPAALLNGLLAAALGLAHLALGDLKATSSLAYLLSMTAVGALVYVPAFLFLPISAIQSESQRWRRAAQTIVARVA